METVIVRKKRDMFEMEMSIMEGRQLFFNILEGNGPFDTTDEACMHASREIPFRWHEAEHTVGEG